MAIIVMAGLLAILARTTGSGWLVVMASGLIPLFVIGAFAPLVPLVRARVALQFPPDGMVGRAVAAAVTVEGRARGLTLGLRDPASGRVHGDGPSSGTIPAVPSSRGVLTSVVAELRSAAPFGFVTWQRTVVVRCRRPLEVAPVPIAGRAPLTQGDPQGDAEGGGNRRGGESVRGIRPYAAGDPFRLVHWPATARWGGVMVRELDDDVPPRLVLVVDLPGDDHDAAEELASRAAGFADDALAAGRRVVLATVERAGTVTALVETPTAAGRRLARAVAGPSVLPPVQPGDVVVRLAIAADGDRR
ncbi:MAG: DUF58 domain-containing protein [Acidimicrobiia bacterium]